MVSVAVTRANDGTSPSSLRGLFRATGGGRDVEPMAPARAHEFYGSSRRCGTRERRVRRLSGRLRATARPYYSPRVQGCTGWRMHFSGDHLLLARSPTTPRARSPISHFPCLYLPLGLGGGCPRQSAAPGTRVQRHLGHELARAGLEEAGVEGRDDGAAPWWTSLVPGVHPTGFLQLATPDAPRAAADRGRGWGCRRSGRGHWAGAGLGGAIFS